MLHYLIALFLVYVSSKLYSYKKNVSLANNYPGSRQMFDGASILVLLGLIPKRFCEWGGDAGFRLKWSNYYKKLGKDVLCSISPRRITFYIADAEAAKQVTTNRKEFFPKPTFFYGVLRIFGENVVTTEDEIWKRHRKIVSHGFSERNNKYVHKETVACTLGLVDELLKSHMNQGKAVIDVVEYTLRIALIVISSAAFGFETRWDHKDKPAAGHSMSFFSALEELSSRPVPMVVCPRWLMHLPIFNLPKLSLAMDEFVQYMNESIQIGKNQPEDKGDLFSALLKGSEAEKQGKDLSLSDDELLGNIYILMVAGHETTAHTLSFALGLLALNQNVQDDFYNEIISVFGDKKAPEYDNLNNLKLGNAIINETLRIYPIVTVIPKWAPNDTNLGDVFIPAESIVNLHVTGLHYNEKYWKDPFEFRPRRFLEEYNKDAFIPFSDGPRSCLGKRFAQIEAVTVLATLVRNFRITLADPSQADTLLEPKIVLTLVPKNPVKLQFTPRQ